ncbi:transporter substrate-binding domain-containing protein [Legionella rowbothamii]|uniref:transporter substrate-binding domain-containing protein n=1 Tax=Legionella rowbothamii TaxID=96229 RepID=UPI001056A232|nr:transporter substrate-binding domain-containing protein [Legionella rowbothamii]
MKESCFLTKQLLAFMLMLFITSIAFSSSLTVGVGVSGPPLVEKAHDSKGVFYFGFSIDLMDSICEQIKETCTYQEVTLNNQFELLDSGKIDLLILTIPYDSSKLKQYAISIPYAASKVQFVTLKTNSINGIKDVENKRIGVMRATFYNLLTQSPYHKNNQIIAYDSNSELYSDLHTHKIDVIALNNALAYGLEMNNIFDLKLIGESILLGDGYGIIALPDKTKLIEKINKAILDIENNGTFTAIYQRYYKY